MDNTNAMQMHMQLQLQLASTSRRSSSKVCARCKKRKTKCDSGYPSCGACARAGAVCRGGEVMMMSGKGGSCSNNESKSKNGNGTGNGSNNSGHSSSGRRIHGGDRRGDAEGHSRQDGSGGSIINSTSGASSTSSARNVNSGTDVPRSLVRALEAQVALLERRVDAVQQQTAGSVARALTMRLVRGTVLATEAAATGLGPPIAVSQFLRPSCLPLGEPAEAAGTGRKESNGDNEGDRQSDREDGAAAASSASYSSSSSSSSSPSFSSSSSSSSSPLPPSPTYSANRTNLGRIPPAALETMVANYASIHLPQYPCLREAWLRHVLARILAVDGGDTDAALTRGLRPESELTHFDYFAVFMVLAVSSLTLTWRNERQARIASDAFFQTAVQHLERTVAVQLPALRRLQACLLLAHYGNLNPARVDNWACIWAATRIALSLGLHQGDGSIDSGGGGDGDGDGNSSNSNSDNNSENTSGRCFSRELFYVTLGMERSLSTILRLPLAVAEEDITIPRLPGRPDGAQASAHHLYRLRVLETEIHRVLWLQDPRAEFAAAGFGNADGNADGERDSKLGPPSLRGWQLDVAARLDEWLRGAEPFQKYQMLEFRLVSYGYLKARLHRPTPRLPLRSPADRAACVAACALLIQDYQRQSRSRRLFYPWHAVHILYEAAVVLLDAAWALRDRHHHHHHHHHHRHCDDHDGIPHSVDPHIRRLNPLYILSVLVPNALDLLHALRAAWPDAVRCVDVLGPVLADVLAVFSDRAESIHTSDTSDTSDTSETSDNNHGHGCCNYSFSRLRAEAAVTARLQKLLFPDGLLVSNRSNTTTTTTTHIISTSSVTAAARVPSPLTACWPPSPPSPCGVVDMRRPPSADDPLGLVALGDMDWDAYWDTVQEMSPPWEGGHGSDDVLGLGDKCVSV